MSAARTNLLDRVVADVSEQGIGDRSLRKIAAGVGSSHRMLLHHFGSREGLVAAIVESVESAQRDLFVDLAGQIDDPGELILALWAAVTTPELRSFVRLFFECVGIGGHDLTSAWLASAADVAADRGLSTDPDLLRLIAAVTRGLLVDVLATGDVASATRSLERFLEIATVD